MDVMTVGPGPCHPTPGADTGGSSRLTELRSEERGVGQRNRPGLADS